MKVYISRIIHKCFYKDDINERPNEFDRDWIRDCRYEIIFYHLCLFFFYLIY